MFPSSNNGHDPIYYSDQHGYNRPFFNDIITSNPKHDQEPPPSFFHLPSPFIPYDQLELQEYDVFLHQNRDLLFHQQQPLMRTIALSDETMLDSNKIDANTKISNTTPTTNAAATTTGSAHDLKQEIPRKRTSKRDRHSKINTAQGPRDRRMRLSLKVAREFFDLQDRLRFDKASKTVEWLLIHARSAIKNLSINSGGGDQKTNYSSSIGTKSASSTSECEVVSGVEYEGGANKATVSAVATISKGNTNKGKRAKPPRRTAFHNNPLARESREKARARARERTLKLLWSRRIDESSSKPCEEGKNSDHELNQLTCWSPFETGEEESAGNNQSHTTNNNPSLELETPSRFYTTEGMNMIDDSLVIMGKWSPSSIISHLYNTGIEHQITEFQTSCKAWGSM